MVKSFILSCIIMAFITSTSRAGGPVRVLVVTGGHGYNKETFGEMLASLGERFTFKVVEFPSAFEMFEPGRRSEYDVLLFYHMWQKISPGQEEIFSGCVFGGKPVVALHHSICAFDGWDEYRKIIGGKYFQRPETLDGKEFPASSYLYDVKISVKVAARHPVTKGVRDFEIIDETYRGYWVDPDARVLLTTNEKTSTPVIGWSKKYGKARVVVMQPGHDTPTFQQPEYRKLLSQALEWVVR